MSEKKQSFKKNSKCRKIFEMLKVDPKTANLATLLNFDVIEKMDAGFGISDQKLMKFD